MSKKIIFLGYKPFLTSIISSLKGSSFIEENKIDIIIAEPNQSRKQFVRNLKKQIKDKNVYRILKELRLRACLFFYKNKNRKILDKLFPEVNIDYINQKKNISVLNYNGLENIENLADYDFMIISSFGIKIPSTIFNAPKERTLNIHPSYLPNLRGGYPTYVESFYMEKGSASTIHYMENGWDNGDIVTQEIEAIDTCATNDFRLKNSAKIGAKLLNELNASSFVFKATKQNKNAVTYCHRELKYKIYINEIETSELEGYIRANYSKSLFPFTYGYYKGFVLSILKIKRTSNQVRHNRIKFYRKKNHFFLQHYTSEFLVEKYIYKGKLIAQNFEN